MLPTGIYEEMEINGLDQEDSTAFTHDPEAELSLNWRRNGY